MSYYSWRIHICPFYFYVEQINFPSCNKSASGIVDSATRENILGNINANTIEPSDCGLNLSSKEYTENIIQGDNINGCTYRK